MIYTLPTRNVIGGGLILSCLGAQYLLRSVSYTGQFGLCALLVGIYLLLAPKYGDAFAQHVGLSNRIHLHAVALFALFLVFGANTLRFAYDFLSGTAGLVYEASFRLGTAVGSLF